ncbi:peptidase M23 [Microbacterium sp. Root166]|uniref:murein hydrolase activator EnvC family protein n=1 Tax=Microbacterium sp. Root166 TaxID=1736478 RepID=UPI0006F62E65|nr:M23 family metallopeptidase [Microbacterium sp. Root166]KQZ84426.1 peptidase M23 [Microbacterium sp. Root166]
MQTNPGAAVRRSGAPVALLAILLVSAVLAPDDRAQGAGDPDAPPPAATAWAWPVDSARIVQAYEAPAHRYGPGHRGIDLRSGTGDLRVSAPADGTVAFAGAVAGRGVLTIDHGDGLVTTLEPVDTALVPGAAVAKGAEVGTVAIGGHTAMGALHFGVRRHGEYINPLLLVGEVPRAVLLPCC